MLIGSVAAGLLCLDPLVAVAGLVATCIIAMLRREEESLPLLFCLGFQWLFIVAGIIYRGLYGRYPNDYGASHLNAAVLLLLLALLVMTVGIWASLRVWTRVPIWRRKCSRLPKRSHYAPDKLFLCVIILFASSWITETSPKLVAYSISQVLYRLVEFRNVFLFLLFLVVLRQRQGRAFALVAGLFVTLPTVTGGGLVFAGVLLVLLLAVLVERRSLFVEGLQTERNRRTFLVVCGIAFVLAYVGVLWQGAIKASWRPIARGGEIEASRVERIGMFFNVAAERVEHLDWHKGIESLAQRLSDVPAFMALVCERVPAHVPHSDGALTMRTAKHITMPRFLFPDKENLGSDSWLVRKYTGLNVAGAESNTSIGLSYLIEFYIDYGVPGMFVAALGFGLIVGSLHRALLLVAQSMDLYRGAAAAILLQHFMTLEGSLAKIVGGLVMSYAVFGILLLLFGAQLHRSLQVRQGQSARLRAS